MFGKFKKKLKSKKEKGMTEEPDRGFTFGDAEQPMTKVFSYQAGSAGSFRRKRRKSRADDLIALSPSTNPEGVLNPMNIFDHTLVSKGWPVLKYERCPIPHSIRAVTTRAPVEDDELENTAPITPGRRTAILLTDEDFTDEAVDWYKRYKAFYQRYCPSKVDSVGSLLQGVYDKGADPSDLWAKMLEKYGTTEETWETVDWKDRLTKFYTIHAKEKLDTIQQVLAAQQQNIDMDTLWKKMLEKYGVTEHNWEEEINWQRRFTAFYYIHCKEKVDMVPKLLRQLEERGAQPLDLWLKMLEKYEVTEGTWRHPSSKVDWYDRFATFYNLHAPDRKESVDQLMRHITDKGAEPADLWPKLLEKYNLTEENWFVPPELPKQETKEVNWEERFTKLLSIHAPHQVETVPELLVQEQGSLEFVWKLLLEQYKVTEETWDKPRKINPWKKFLMAVSVTMAFKKATQPKKAQDDPSPAISIQAPEDVSPQGNSPKSPSSQNLFAPSPGFPSSPTKPSVSVPPSQASSPAPSPQSTAEAPSPLTKGSPPPPPAPSNIPPPPPALSGTPPPPPAPSSTPLPPPASKAPVPPPAPPSPQPPPVASKVPPPPPQSPTSKAPPPPPPPPPR
eukprot:TRINITY_DN4768_c0_g1_i1.p1 TRINITY_DN4768_c0_g1~~TRINITY_DN4768_c0_g1_i1.p1  ORF type:complete len:618 (+),score=162.34 TRINITY_DN4768_c0_g1_i1:1420-3273(+)